MTLVFHVFLRTLLFPLMTWVLDSTVFLHSNINHMKNDYFFLLVNIFLKKVKKNPSFWSWSFEGIIKSSINYFYMKPCHPEKDQIRKSIRSPNVKNEMVTSSTWCHEQLIFLNVQCVENLGDTVSIGVFKYFLGVASVVELKTSLF